MVRKEYEIGYYLTDASFDKATKLSTVSVLNLITKNNLNFTKVFNNTKEAETFGIIEAIKNAYNNKYKHIIVMCDNLSSVNEVKYQINTTNFWKNKFNSIQILWIPRDQTFLADFFSKNIDADKKEDYIESRINKYSTDIEKLDITKLMISNNDKTSLLFKKVDLLKENFNEIENFKYTSKVLSDIIINKKFNFKESIDIDILKEDIMKLITLNYKMADKKGPLFFIMEFILTESKY